MSELVHPQAPVGDVPDTGRPAPLDRTLARIVTINWEVVAWVVLVCVTLATRLWFLGQRSMSHDESLHTYYSWRLFNGEGYVHDPMMHGPLLYHLTALTYFLFGVSDFTARLVTVFLGLGLVLCPLLLRRYLGRVGALATAAILVLSPTVMYYTRYIRHDIHVEFFIVLLFASLYKYLDTRRAGWLVAIGIAGAGAVTSAEMAYIMGFILVIYVLFALIAERVGQRQASWLAVTMGMVGLALLIIAVFISTGRLDPPPGTSGALMLGDHATKGSLLRDIMQNGLLFSGLLLALSLGVGLLTRFGTAVVTPTVAAGRTLRDILPLGYFSGEHRGSPGVLAASGAVVAAFGVALARFLPGVFGGISCVANNMDAPCVLIAVVGRVIPTIGLVMLMLGIGGYVVAAWPRLANLLILVLGGVTAAAGLALHRWQVATMAAGGATGQSPLTSLPIAYLFDALLYAGAIIALYGLVAWLLEGDGQRGLAEAFASAPTSGLVLAVIAFFVIYVLMFTTFFSNAKGIFGFYDSVKYWVDQHEVVRGDQPWYYYLIFAPMYEFLPLILAIVAGFVYSFRPALRVGRGNESGAPDNPEPGARIFVPMLITWCIGVFWVFSWAGEKMPWLIVHLVVPTALLAGRLVADIVGHVDWAAFRARGWQLAGLALLLCITALAIALPPLMDVGAASAAQAAFPVLGLVVVAALAYGCWRLWRDLGAAQALLTLVLTGILMLAALNTRYALMANFVNGELATEYIVYAHGTPDDKLVYNTLRDLQQRIGVDKPLSIVYDDDVSWPFTWYFRNSDWSNASYVGKKPTGSMNADVALVGSANYSNFEPYMGKRYVSTEFTRMWWPNEGYKDLTWDKIKAAILDPKLRRNWLNILLYRRYTKDPAADTPEAKSLTDWYHHSNMRLYIKKDLIEKAWPLVQARPEWLKSVQTTAAAVEVPELKLDRDLGFTAPGGEKPLSAPKDVALGPNGDVYVMDFGNFRIMVFGADGTFKTKIGDGEFFSKAAKAGDPDEASAWGIGVGPDGAVYVADTWHHQVVKYKDGQRVQAWGQYGNPADPATDLDKFYGPRDVAVGPDGNVYVTDTGNRRILVFSDTGQPIRAIVDAGADMGVFNEPTSLAFDPATGDMYVADLWSQRIIRFNKDLKPETSWTVDGWTSQEAAHKAYLAIGPNSTVIASDPEAQRVWIFDRNGKALGTLNLPMDEQGLDQPIGVAVDNQGRIIVAASNTGAVTRYAPADAILKASSQPAPVAPAGQQGGAGQVAPLAASPTAAQVGPAGGGAAQPGPSVTGMAPGPNPRPVKP